MMDATLKELQGVLFNMLNDIDVVCQKNGISYQLFAGSALGAVREHGFIPWDDDLDIAMARTEYDRFLEAAEKELDSEKYYVQKEFSEHYYHFSSKIRLNNTTFMERYIPRDKKMHQGVYVDIFPLDNLADNALLAKLQFYASKIVIAKSLRRRGYATDSVKKKLFLLICSILPLRCFLRFTQRRKDKTSRRVHSFFGGSSKYDRSVYPRDILKTRSVSFENGTFPVSAEYDRLLTIQYGDYMTPTEAAQRDKKRHYLKLDLQHCYEDYLDWQDQQIITSYTESIR